MRHLTNCVILDALDELRKLAAKEESLLKEEGLSTCASQAAFEEWREKRNDLMKFIEETFVEKEVQ